jgi:hypothetical protein
VTRDFKFIVVVCFLLAVFVSAGAEQNQDAPAPARQTVSSETRDSASNKTTPVQPVSVAGEWQVSWTGRLGVEQCAIQFQQDGAKLTGTLKDQRGLSHLTGTVDEKKISFEVQFASARPFAIRFNGTVNNDKIEGTSQAVGVQAYLGHPGEVVHPEHPWTATRGTEQSSHSTRVTATPQNTPKN